MKTLSYDPANGADFWEAIRKLPGFPTQETMPIQEMIFESDALFRISDVLKRIGAPGRAVDGRYGYAPTRADTRFTLSGCFDLRPRNVARQYQ